MHHLRVCDDLGCQQGMSGELWIFDDYFLRLGARCFNQFQISQRFHADVRDAPLLAAAKLARAALQ